MASPKDETVYTNTQHLRLMLQAVDAVISGSMSQREAAKAFNIPRSTLRCHLPRHETYKHKVQKTPSNSRGKAIFSKKEEKELIEYLINMHRCGFGRTRKDFMLKLQETLNKAERTTKFEDNMPSDDWFSAFLERHKDEVKECIIHYGSQEKGLIPADVLGVNQAVIEEVVQTVDPSTVTIADVQHHHHLHQQGGLELSGDVGQNTYHHLTGTQHQLPASLGGHTVQVQIHDQVHEHLLQQQQQQQQQQHHHQHQHHSQLQGVLQSATVGSQQQQLQGQLQQSGQQVFIHRPSTTVESVARCRTLPFPFQL